MIVTETHERNDFCWLGGEFVSKFFVKVNQVVDLNVAVVLLEKGILS